MKGVSRLLGLLGTAAEERVTGIAVADLQAVRMTGIDAYELVDQLPRGPARLAAWNAYALETYGDKLLAASLNPDFVTLDTARLATEAFQLAGWWVGQASELASNPAAPAADHLRDALPHFHTPLRSHEQLIALRDTLDSLRAYVAFDLKSLEPQAGAGDALNQQLGAIDRYIAQASMLWIEDPPPEMREGIGDAITNGIDKAYALGQALAKHA
jgi:hypothetical protein